MTKRPTRKAIPKRIIAHLCIEQCGICGCGCGVKMDALREGTETQHVLPLRARAVNEAGDDYDPPQLDPQYLSQWRKPCHRAATRKADRVTIHKAKRRHEPKNKPKAKIAQPTKEQRQQNYARNKAWAAEMKAQRGQPV